MGARKGHKHEMRVRVSECGGIWPRAGMGAELWLEAFREMLLLREGTHPYAVPPSTAGGGVGVLGEVMEVDSIPCLFSERRAKTPAGEEGRDLVRFQSYFKRSSF